MKRFIWLKIEARIDPDSYSVAVYTRSASSGIRFEPHEIYIIIITGANMIGSFLKHINAVVHCIPQTCDSFFPLQNSHIFLSQNNPSYKCASLVLFQFYSRFVWFIGSFALPFSIFSVSIFHLFCYEHAQHLNWAVNTEFLLKRSIFSKNTDVVVFHFMYIFIFARFYDFKAEKSAHDYLQPFIFQLLFVAFIFLFVSCFLFVFILFGEIKRHHTFIQTRTLYIYIDLPNHIYIYKYTYVRVGKCSVRTRSMIKKNWNETSAHGVMS